MSDVVELRDLDDARRFLLQGLWLQRAVQPTAGTVKPALEWALEIAAGGHPLPPVGFVADLGHVALGLDRAERAHGEPVVVPGFPSGLARTYEDHVLGKVYADWTFERASDALRRYQGPDQKRDRARGLAYIVKQIRERGGFPGVELSPGVIRNLLEGSPDEHLVKGYASLAQAGPLPLLVSMYEAIVAGARRMAELLALEDVRALELRTALADLGQYVAHRQIEQMARILEDRLPRQKVRPLAGRQEVPTRVLDEDTYPVGGFASISTRGSIESLLHSQLAYMEKDPALQPDLFDVKFLRDELYFYSRDENQFLRRRRSFVFALLPDLVQTRFKDAELPCQRIVLVLSLLVTTVRKLSEWLSTDALRFEFLLVKEGANEPLAQEGHLLEMLLREMIENQTVGVAEAANLEAVGTTCSRKGRRSLCHLLLVSPNPPELQPEETVVSRLRIDGPQPVLEFGNRAPSAPDADYLLEGWVATLERLLQLWV